MLIEEKALQHWIDNFYGYGSWNASFWFIGYEENGGELPEEVADKLNYFQKVHAQPDGALCDIRELYKHVALRRDHPKANLFNNLYEYRFDKDAIQSSVWKNLIAFLHGYKNETLPDLLSYQQQSLATQHASKEAIIPLYPLPSSHNHAWYYSWLEMPQHGFLKSRALYEEHMYPQRISKILSNISTHKPELVLMYGMNNINTIKKSIQEVYHNVQFKMEKAIKLQIPQHHRVELNGTTMLITTQIPTLRHNRIETGFDWEEFGKRVKGISK